MCPQKRRKRKRERERERGSLRDSTGRFYIKFPSLLFRVFFRVLERSPCKASDSRAKQISNFPRRSPRYSRGAATLSPERIRREAFPAGREIILPLFTARPSRKSRVQFASIWRASFSFAFEFERLTVIYIRGPFTRNTVT